MIHIDLRDPDRNVIRETADQYPCFDPHREFSTGRANLGDPFDIRLVWRCNDPHRPVMDPEHKAALDEIRLASAGDA